MGLQWKRNTRDLRLQQMIHSSNHSLIGNPRCTCLPTGNLCLHFPLYYSTFASLALRNFLIEFIISWNAVHMLLSMQNLTNLVVVTFWSWLDAVTWSFSFQGSLLFPRGFSVFKMCQFPLPKGRGRGVYQYLGISEPLRVWHLTQLRTKKPLIHAIVAAFTRYSF